MKSLQKLILPGLILIIVAILYFMYFVPSDELGDFSRLDPNSNASVPVIVKVITEKGIQRDQDGHYSFYVVDKNNREMLRTLPCAY